MAITSGALTAQAATLTEAQKILSSDGFFAQQFGGPVSIDGDWMIVGVQSDTLRSDPTCRPGSAYIYKREPGGRWTEHQKLYADVPECNSVFGSVVDISGDRAIVGAETAARAFVFVKGGDDVWTMEQELVGDDAPQDVFYGKSVAIDGLTAAVGAFFDDDAGTMGVGANTGAVYVFVNDGIGNWSQQDKLLPSDGVAQQSGPWMGFTVDVDGDTIATGAIAHSGGGAVYIFERDISDTWAEQSILTVTGGSRFGDSVSLDGDILLIGAPGTIATSQLEPGAAYVFERNMSNTFVERTQLTGSDQGDTDRLGACVSVNAGVAVVSATNHDLDGEADTGAAYVYRQDQNGDWPEIAKLVASDGEFENYFGCSAVFGNSIASASSDDNANGFLAGALYVFDQEQIGRAAILRRSDDGKWIDYILGGTDVDRKSQVKRTRNLDYTLESRGDFNGDGSDDILLRDHTGNQDGRWVMYVRRGLSALSGGFVDMIRKAKWTFGSATDMNGDGTDDVLLRNSVNGRWLVYFLLGNTVLDVFKADLGTLPTDQLQGTGDFNGDRTHELLMRRADGSWLIQDPPSQAPQSIVFESYETSCVTPSSYEIRLNDQVLLATQANAGLDCACESAQIESNVVSDSALIAAAWNHDSTNELRFIKSSGDTVTAHVLARLQYGARNDSVCLYQPDGNFNTDCLPIVDFCTALTESGDVDHTIAVTQTPQASPAGLSTNTDFATQTIADFDGDGDDDILVRRSDGRWRMYLMSGASIQSQGSVALTKSIAFQFQVSADFSGDGNDDILLRKTDGRWFMYLMDGVTVTASGAPSLTRNTGFQIVRVDDFNQDGKSDLLLRHSDGRWVVYLMDGLTVVEQSSVGVTRNTTWEPMEE